MEGVALRDSLSRYSTNAGIRPRVACWRSPSSTGMDHLVLGIARDVRHFM